MSCWCEKVPSYICTNCEDKQIWARLNMTDKLKFLALAKLTYIENKTDNQWMEFEKLDSWAAENELDLSMIPEEEKYYKNEGV